MKQYFENKLSALVSADLQGSPFNYCIGAPGKKPYPQHLYKYRDCSEDYNFAMIEEDYLYANNPTNFWDPFDSLVNHKLKTELPIIEQWLYSHLGEILYYHLPPKGMQPHKQGQSLQAYLDIQNGFLDSTGRFSTKRAKQMLTIEINKLPPSRKAELLKLLNEFEKPEFEQKVHNWVENAFRSFVNVLRDKCLVCCLTQRRDNQKMWEDYADRYSGFLIEYNLSLASNHSGATATLTRTFPVTYRKRFPKVPMLPFIQRAFYKDLYDENIDIFDSAKKLYRQLLIKKADYAGEEEWRILSPTHRIDFPIISAVYMGYRITDQNAQRLLKICGSKNIPLYRQVINQFTGEMHFELVQQ